MEKQIFKISAKILPIIFFFGLFAFPLIMWPQAPVPYEIPRVWFIQRWIEVLGICGVAASPVLLTRRKIDGKLIFLLISFIAVSVISSFIGVDLQKSLWGNYYRGDGLVTFFHLIGLALFIMLFWEKSWREKSIKAIGCGVFIVSLWSIMTALRLFLLGDKSVDIWGNGAIGASFGNPNFLAGFLVVTLPFVMYLISKYAFFWKYFGRLVLILELLAITFTRSWAGAFGMFLFLAGWVLIQRPKSRWPVIVVLAGCLSILSYLYFKQNQRLGFVAEGRERIVRRILLGAGRRPLLGYGWANSDYAFEAVTWPIPLDSDVYVDKAHSQLLEVLATTGVLGLLVNIGLIGRIGILLFRRIKKDKDDLWPKILLLVFILYILHSQTNIISIGEETFFWLVAGLVGIDS